MVNTVITANAQVAYSHDLHSTDLFSAGTRGYQSEQTKLAQKYTNIRREKCSSIISCLVSQDNRGETKGEGIVI